nr:unnamed protein product [Digitaria exilis]
MAEIETLFQIANRPPRRTPRDNDWEEVREINSYAVFMGYLSMAIRGMGILVVTWTTVVLLGGFVSKLNRHDFWCITVITFMQAAGLVPSLFFIFCPSSLIILLERGCMVKLHNIITSVEIFCLYIAGPYAPIWLAVWRIKHLGYYGNVKEDDSKANLKVALFVLYALVIAQGVLIYYRTIFTLAVKKIVKKLVTKYKFDNWASASVWAYLSETRIGCSKNPSFTRRRNLITYAAELIKSESADRNLWGARILDTLIQFQLQKPSSTIEEGMLIGQNMLIKQLIGSTDIIKKLLRMLDSRCPYDKEMRKRATRVVAHLAGSINLKQFPGGIDCITSLLCSLDEYHLLVEPYRLDWQLHVCEQDWYPQPQAANLPASLNFGPDEDDIAHINGYKELVQQGLTILRKLATTEGNCVIMSSTRGLLSKVFKEMLGQDMAPITQEMAIASLLSLCLTACDRFPLQLQAIGNSICDDDTINFPLWLKAIVDCKDTQGRQKA